MNLILLYPSDFIPNTNIVRLHGRRQKHVLDIHQAKVGQNLIIGIENGLIGDGSVLKNDNSCLEMEVSLVSKPPSKLPVILAVAMMRPIVFKRVLQTAASMGVSEIMVFHSRRVEKSFWQSSALAEEAIREQLILGLEQAKDTVIPKVTFHKRFKPFVEDVLAELLKGRGGRGEVRGVVADPSGDPLTSYLSPLALRQEPLVLVVGPEGGFIPYEIEKFKDIGCHVVSMGERILRVETAITALLAKLF